MQINVAATYKCGHAVLILSGLIVLRKDQAPGP